MPPNNLSQNFVECYRDFDKSFKDWVKDHGRPSDDNPSYLMFGTSGAGKSTLMARMVSDKKPDEFLQAISTQNREGFVMLDGIKLGQSPLVSTTLIPKPYLIEGLSIFDMPGFNDTDESRDIIIGVLHKCLLTRIRAAKFIVVLGAEVLLGTVESRVILDYCKAFSRLFGDAYENGLKHLYFVFTKNDKHKLSNDQADMAMFKLLKGVGTLGDKLAGPFLARMASFYCLLDYSTEAHPFAALKQMIETDQAGKGEVMSAGRLNVSHLDVHESMLTVKCGEEINKVQTTVDGRAKDFHEQHEQVKRQIDGLRKAAKGNMTSHKGLLADMSKLTTELHAVDTRLGGFNERYNKLQEQLVKYQSQGEFCGRQLEFLKDGLADFDVVSFRCDVALVPPSGTFGQRPAKIDATIDLGQHGRTDSKHIVLITVAEPNDSSLKSHIAATEKVEPTLQPQRLDTITAFRHEAVLYHSHNMKSCFANADGNRCRVTATPDNQYLQIQAEYPRSFKVYVYYAVKFMTTPEYRKLRAKYDDEVRDCTTQAATYRKQVEELQKENDTDQKRRAELLVNHKLLAQHLHDSTMSLRGDIKSLARSSEQMHRSLEGFLQAARPEDYPSVAQVSEVGEIYVENKLKTDLMERITKVKETLQQLRTAIQSSAGETVKACSAISAEEEEVMLTQPHIPEGLLLPVYNFSFA